MRHAAAVLLAVLAALSLHAALGPGAELPVSSPLSAPIPGSQTTLAVATDGTDFLALWRDETPGRDGIYATVLSDDGGTRPLAPVPLLRGGLVDVSAVWTGNSYLVALTRYLEPGFVLSLNRDGEVVSPLRPLDLGGSMGITGMAWNGSRVLAVARDGSGTSAALLDAEGNVVRSGIPLPGGAHDFRVEAAGDAFIAVWVERLAQAPPTSRVRAARISAMGNVSSSVKLTEPIEGSAFVDVETASDGTKVGVVARTGSSADTVIYRSTIDAKLAVDADPPLALKPYASSNIEVLATSRGFVATYFAINNAQLKTIAFGSSTVRTIDLWESPGYGVQTASNGRAVMAFWGIYPTRAAAFDASLTRMTSGIIAVPRAPVAQGKPVIASAGDTALTAWLEYGLLRLRRMNQWGDPIDPLPLAVAGNVGDRPALVFTGQVWLIAFADDTGIRVQRMSPDGKFLGAPLTLDIPAGDVAIAWNGKVAALVMTSSFRRKGLTLVRFSAAGERLDASPIVLTDARAVDSPAIASNGDGFLVVWSQAQGYSPRLQGKRLDPSGNPIEAEPIAVSNRDGFSESAAQVASNGTDYVVAYVQYGAYVPYDPPSQDDPHPDVARIYTKRVLATGVLADTTAGQAGTFVGLGTFPAIAADGQRYVTTFRKDGTDELWLFAAPLDGRGVPLAAPRLLLRAGSYGLEHGLANVGGAISTAYSRIVPELTNVHRVFLREVTEQQARRRGSRN
ncbi:MAG TPA: hypothetical protein VFP80_11570 [Thermoanaerobaculia bacterium]|nr:hypothetical protein [Thermoanaerobaculia bacterium]